MKLMKKEKVPILKNWLGREGLQFMQTLKQIKQESYHTVAVLFKLLCEIFRLQHNKSIYLYNSAKRTIQKQYK